MILCDENVHTDPENQCEHGAVRLMGGVTNYTGRLEFCAYGLWGKVCNDLYWSPENTKIVCHQLGFSEESKNVQETL